MDAFETVDMELHERKGIKRPASASLPPALTAWLQSCHLH